MVREFSTRSGADSAAERDYLEKRLKDIEAGMGRVSAESRTPGPITQRMDALDRARELTNDMLKQIYVRSLDEALDAQLDWLGRVEARQHEESGEPKTSFDKIALDRRLLTELRDGWHAERA